MYVNTYTEYMAGGLTKIRQERTEAIHSRRQHLWHTKCQRRGKRERQKKDEKREKKVKKKSEKIERKRKKSVIKKREKRKKTKFGSI